jgi:hypothetical protein
MKRKDLIWGALLIGAGIVLLMQNFGLFGTAAPTIWSILFLLGGAGFVGLFATNRALWWALIPGFTLLGLGTLLAVELLAPALAAAWGGSIFLAGIGLGFWAVYLAHPGHWWAIIPGGVLVTLAVVAGFDSLATGFDTGAIFFGGLALTFALVYLLPTEPRRMGWALIPTAICAALALVIVSSSTAVLDFVWPAALIVVGLYFVYRTFRGTPERIEEVEPGVEERYDDTSLPQPH